MSVRFPVWATISMAVLLLAPELAAAQAGVGAWDPEHGETFSPTQFGKQPAMGSNASGSGVGNPLGFKESTPPVTGLPPAKIDPAIEYAKGFTDLNFGRLALAEQEFDAVLKVDPRNPKALFMLGETKVALGDLKGAAGAFEKALKYDPGQITIRGEYAVTLARLGKAHEAEAQLADLNARAVACGGSCIEADDYKVEVGRIQAALSAPGKANS